MSDDDVTRVWQLVIETEQLDDGSWRAGLPGRSWSMTGDTEQEARDRATAHAVEIGEDADDVARNSPRRVIELEDDDPRIGWVWRFTPQTEQFGDGSWRAWFASGGWTVSGATEAEVVERAQAEWFRRREDPDEVARRIATMRRHLVEPVPGFQNTPNSVLDKAWDHPNPRDAVRSIIDGLDASR